MNEQMSNWRWAAGGLLLTGVLSLGLWGMFSSEVRADRDGNEHEERHQQSYQARSRAEPLPLYSQECGGCHLAYPARLLPESGWRAIMDTLDDHFGDNATLEQAERSEIEHYLVNNAADNGRYDNARYVATVERSSVPMRITELPFFIREHDEIPQRLVQDNDQVGSFSRCEACHTEAVRGRFDEDRVRIAGYGRWDD